MYKLYSIIRYYNLTSVDHTVWSILYVFGWLIKIYTLYHITYMHKVMRNDSTLFFWRERHLMREVFDAGRFPRGAFFDASRFFDARGFWCESFLTRTISTHYLCQCALSLPLFSDFLAKIKTEDCIRLSERGFYFS